MSSFRRFSIRLGIYTALLLAIALDFLYFQGPLYRKVQANLPDSPESVAEMRSRGVAATVFQHEITEPQIQRELTERLWQLNREASDLTSDQLALARTAALSSLVDRQIMRTKVGVNTKDLPVSEEEITHRINELRGRFATEADFTAALKESGLENGLRDRIAAWIQQDKYIVLRTNELIQVTEEEVAAWYEEHRAALAGPAEIEARHVFLAANGDRSEEAAVAELEEMRAALAAQSTTFEQLAEASSEDLASRHLGGQLGWLSESRLPPDFIAPAAALPLNQPAIIRTKRGWHLVEQTGRREPSAPTLEACRAEIHAALESRKRMQAVPDFRSALRRFEEHRVAVLK